MTKPPKKWTPDEIERRGKLAHQKWLVKIGYKKPTAPVEEPAATPREDAINALEAALPRSKAGRQLLTLLEETSKLRIRESLSAELVRVYAEDVERLRRVRGRDLIAREQAAAKLPYAQARLAKWQRAHADFQYRREILEYTMRDMARALQ